MTEETQSNNQQMIVIALIVVAVLLAAIVGVLIWQKTSVQGALPSPTANNAASPAGAADGAAAGAAGGGAAPAGMGGGSASAAPTEFDAKTATKVPAGSTPEQMLKAYGSNILAKKYADAYNMLPLDKKKSYGTVAGYEQQVAGYNISDFKTGTPVTAGDTVTIVSSQVTPDMPSGITYTWTFKKVGGQWYVVSRAMGGQVQ